MRIIFGILAINLIAMPVEGKVRHGRRGALGSGSQFIDFSRPNRPNQMPAIIDLSESSENVRERPPSTTPNVAITEELDNTIRKPGKPIKGKLASDEIAVIGEKGKVASAGSLAGTAGSLRKGGNLSNGPRAPGERTGNAETAGNQDVNFTENGSSSWGLTATIICNGDACQITPDGGSTVDSSLPAAAQEAQEVIQRTYHSRYRNVSLTQALGGDASDVISLAWNRSLGELGINATNAEYYYGANEATRNALTNQDFAQQVGSVLFKPIEGEPNRYAIVGGG